MAQDINAETEVTKVLETLQSQGFHTTNLQSPAPFKDFNRVVESMPQQ